MLKELDDYDWAEVFGEGSGGNCTPIIPNLFPLDKETSPATFSREDVVLIKGQVEGENDEADWVVWGQLKDGRWFVARGGCDYTGWDCRADNSGNVASSEAAIIRDGMDNGERERFELTLPCPNCGELGGEIISNYSREYQGESPHGGYVEFVEEMCTKCKPKRRS